jgi:hypothetical protein
VDVGSLCHLYDRINSFRTQPFHHGIDFVWYKHGCFQLFDFACGIFKSKIIAPQILAAGAGLRCNAKRRDAI